MAGRPEGFAPRCAVVAGFGGVTAAFDGAAAVLDGVADVLAAGAAPAPAVADRATGRGEDDAVAGVDRVGDGDGTAEREG
ncbi:hypothetical protein [Streptomyces virginiae]|uniref:hypothetical protein n=1 Tax=Streptomyces virginiae TaxID=1961 RepID=UPI002DBFEB33|nr:hypothetical protein [Streptomyces sp. CMAA1738]MEC4570301.1 hypothetical protein [Streptomyces sp. CMAA1738]